MRFFLIDKVTELVLGERATGVKNVTYANGLLHDHFPDFPVFPGSLIIESAAQLAGFLVEMTARHEGMPVRAVLGQVDKAKFHRPCVPGDRLIVEAQMVSMLDNAARVQARVKAQPFDRTADVSAAQMVLTFALRGVESTRLDEQRRSLYRIWTTSLDIDLPF